MTEQDRIANKAHELWEAEGRPHGRDQAHWDQAKEIVAIEDGGSAALLPRTSGAEAPVESTVTAIDNQGDVPGLTDTGEHDLTATAREPAASKPKAAAPKLKSAAKTASHRADAAKTSKVVAPAKKAAAKAK